MSTVEFGGPPRQVEPLTLPTGQDLDATTRWHLVRPTGLSAVLTVVSGSLGTK
jgi:hypothetical protein